MGKILAEDHPGVRFEPILEFVIQNALLVSASPLPEGVCDDPDDDKFLACAVASESNIVVSGDRLLLNVSGHQKIEVFNPREFLEKHLF